MPINIPNSLPATEILEKENIFTIDKLRAESQDIRPLRIAILNLMPTKIVTETQLLRLLSNTPLQIDITLLTTSSYAAKNTPAEHLKTFYTTFDNIKDSKFDGFIITGAPLESMEFEAVSYWEELCEIMEWTKHNVFSTMFICWGAFAGLHYKYGIDKHILKSKISGVFSHRTLCPSHPLVRGFDEEFNAPHSRYSGVYSEEIENNNQLILLAKSDEVGPYLAASKDGRNIFVFGHGEYDAGTLQFEYERDINRGLNPDMPKNYFKNNDTSIPPINTWRAHSHMLFSNWLNYFVYQNTPYNLEEIL
ncbi:MAG: homoserine O-succinyltransferase [Ruminococcaceae bacterium]|nr:homoserine O-succinyltransferase [Oscillospiraceae bacterium]